MKTGGQASQKKRQDLLLDVIGPLAMSYELVSQVRENPEQLGLPLILSSVTKGIQLVGNFNSHLSSKRRAQVLSKTGHRYTSLSNEKWDNNGKELFGQQFEQRLKQSSETAKAISSP